MRVLDTAKDSQVDHRVPQQLHPVVLLLNAFKAEQQPLELVFPRKGPLDTHASRLDHGLEEPLPSTLGGFAIASRKRPRLRHLAATLTTFHFPRPNVTNRGLKVWSWVVSLSCCDG